MNRKIGWILLLCIVQATTTFACDVCGCYMGIQHKVKESAMPETTVKGVAGITWILPQKKFLIKSHSR